MQLLRATNPVTLNDGADITAIEMARAGSWQTARAVLCPRISCRKRRQRSLRRSRIYSRALRNVGEAPGQRQNRESRAKDARYTRTLTFILSLTGRGDRTSGVRSGRSVVEGAVVGAEKDPGFFAALRMTKEAAARRFLINAGYSRRPLRSRCDAAAVYLSPRKRST
jgi:hypothetical protein